MSCSHQECYSATERDTAALDRIPYDRLRPDTFVALVKRLDGRETARSVMFGGGSVCVRCAARAIRNFEELQRWIHEPTPETVSLSADLSRSAGREFANCTIEIEAPFRWPPGSVLPIRACLLRYEPNRTAFLRGYAERLQGFLLQHPRVRRKPERAMAVALRFTRELERHLVDSLGLASPPADHVDGAPARTRTQRCADRIRRSLKRLGVLLGLPVRLNVIGLRRRRLLR